MVYFELKIPVQYYETDQMAVVHHSNYIRYFECSRSAFMRELGYSVPECERDGIVLPVVGLECKYVYPARMGDTLTITTEIKELPLAKLRIYHKVFNQNGKLCAEGRVDVAFLRQADSRLTACPQRFVDLMAARMGDKE